MYWMGSDYDRMAKLVIDIFLDYGIKIATCKRVIDMVL